MNDPVDRERIAELLADTNLSYREIAREAGCSDWTVRRIARDLDGDERPMKAGRQSRASDEGGGISGWVLLAGAIGIIGAIWYFNKEG